MSLLTISCALPQFPLLHHLSFKSATRFVRLAGLARLAIERLHHDCQDPPSLLPSPVTEFLAAAMVENSSFITECWSLLREAVWFSGPIAATEVDILAF